MDNLVPLFAWHSAAFMGYAAPVTATTHGCGLTTNRNLARDLAWTCVRHRWWAAGSGRLSWSWVVTTP